MQWAGYNHHANFTPVCTMSHEDCLRTPWRGSRASVPPRERSSHILQGCYHIVETLKIFSKRSQLWKTTWAIFWKNCKKYGKSTKKCPSNKGARFARPFCRQFCCTFSIWFAIFPKNGPGSFPHLDFALPPLSYVFFAIHFFVCRRRATVAARRARRASRLAHS